MYQIRLNDIVFYDVRDKDLIIENPELDLEINKVGTLKFKVYPSHPYFNQIENKISKFTVYKDNKIIFKGRVINEEQGIYSSKNIEVEDSLAYLNDSIVRPYEFNGTPEQHFINLINNHNEQVTEDQKLLVGMVTVKDANDYIVRSSEKYDITLKVITDDLINKLGGYLRLRYTDEGTYIDYLEDFNDTSTQTIELGKNLIDVLVENNATEVYSVVIPLGAETEQDGIKTRLTIKSVNENKDYLINQTAYDKYGWIVAPVDETTWDDVTIASNLKTKGQQYLDNQAVMLKSSLEIDAIDLNVTDANIEAFFIYEYVRFISTIHNLNRTYLLTKISIPLDKPENMRITLGEETSSLTGIQVGSGNKVDDLANKVGIVEKNYTINNEKLNDIEKSITYFSVDLAQYNISVATDENRIPLESKTYDINYSAYFKGELVKPTVTIVGTNAGITTSTTDTYIRFITSSTTAITNLINEYTITFTYSVDGITYKVNKKVDIVLALKGSDGTSVNILGSYNTLEELKAAHPTGSVGDAYIVQGSMYVWCVDNNDWQNVGNIQGPRGPEGTSSYLHIRYSDDGLTFTANEGKDVGKYRGELVSTNPVASTVFEDYTWFDMSIVVDDELASIREELQTNITAIEQNTDEIVMTALEDYVAKNEFASYQETVSTEFTQTAEDFNFQFNNITSQITTLDGETQQQFQEINKYIRFVDGNIILGEDGNEITLKIENDRIAFIQNNTEVAYFSNNKLTVTDGDFLTSLKIGNFAFKPRSNGNLSLVYVGGDTV
jgi:hypothetical protein